MVISTDNQLVPYNLEPGQVIRYTPPKTADDPADHEHGYGPYPPLPDLRGPGPGIYSENQGYLYTSSSQLIAQETDRVGLLINIYA